MTQFAKGNFPWFLERSSFSTGCFSCWWKKSENYSEGPMFHRVLYIPGGAGFFFPSAVWSWRLSEFLLDWSSAITAEDPVASLVSACAWHAKTSLGRTKRLPGLKSFPGICHEKLERERERDEKINSGWFFIALLDDLSEVDFWSTFDRPQKNPPRPTPGKLVGGCFEAVVANDLFGAVWMRGWQVGSSNPSPPIQQEGSAKRSRTGPSLTIGTQGHGNWRWIMDEW